MFVTIITSVDDHNQYSKVFLIDGPGGTGEASHYIITLVEYSFSEQNCIGFS